MKKFPLPLAICSFMFIHISLAAGLTGPFFHNSSANEPSPAMYKNIRVVVWLQSDSVIVEGGVYCFGNEFLVSRNTDLLLYTSNSGPIGVKEVVDALRMSSDESCGEGKMPRNQVWNFLQGPDEVLHIVWKPSEPSYEFFLETLPPGSGAGCHIVPVFPAPGAVPIFSLRGNTSTCSSILLKRAGVGSQATGIPIAVSVPLNCP